MAQRLVECQGYSAASEHERAQQHAASFGPSLASVVSIPQPCMTPLAPHGDWSIRSTRHGAAGTAGMSTSPCSPIRAAWSADNGGSMDLHASCHGAFISCGQENRQATHKNHRRPPPMHPDPLALRRVTLLPTIQRHNLAFVLIPISQPLPVSSILFLLESLADSHLSLARYCNELSLQRNPTLQTISKVRPSSHSSTTLITTSA